MTDWKTPWPCNSKSEAMCLTGTPPKRNKFSPGSFDSRNLPGMAPLALTYILNAENRPSVMDALKTRLAEIGNDDN